MVDLRKLPDDAVNTPPEGLALAVGDSVTFINDYGVIWPGKKVIGFRIPDPDFRPKATVYIDSEPYWFSNDPESLVKEWPGRDIMPEMKWIYEGKSEFGAQIARETVKEYIREFHAETPDPVKLAALKKQIRGIK